MQSEPISGVEDGTPKRIVISVRVMSLLTMFASQHQADGFALTRPFITGATPSGFVMIQRLQSLRETMTPRKTPADPDY